MRMLAFVFVFGCLTGCTLSSRVRQPAPDKGTTVVPQYTPGPQALIYKTKKDYSNLVPVLLSEDKTIIVSFPHPSDLIVGDGYSRPTVLNKGYWLDNRGIGKNVAFLKFTYKEYSELKEVPSLEKLQSLIVDDDPLTELCDCGNKAAFATIEKQLNMLIDQNKLRTTCKILK